MARDSDGLTVTEGVRALLLLMPRIGARVKRIAIPEALRSFSLAPRHLSLFAYLLFDGPMSVNELAARLEVAPTTVSLMIGDLARQGVLDRQEDPADRRRTIVTIAAEHRAAIERWLAKGAAAWEKALRPLTPEQRELFVRTLEVYERETAED